MKIIMYKKTKFKYSTVFKKINKNFYYLTIPIIITLISIALANSLLEMKGETLLDANATPATNKVVVLDAGHGLPDEGATSDDNVSEQELALEITLKLQQLLEQTGVKVILTRSDENGIYSLDSESIKEKKVSDIKNRVEIGNDSSVDIFVSIHLNKYPPSDIYKGWQTFYQGGNDLSKSLAQLIQNNINENINIENNRVPHQITDVYIMEHVKVPSVIVECGFLSNEEETKLLQMDEYQQKLAWGIFIGIQEYFT